MAPGHHTLEPDFTPFVIGDARDEKMLFAVFGSPRRPF
jgi:hypothetical protein